MCGFAENRRNRRKSTHGEGYSPKSGDDRIGQVFSLRHRQLDRVSAGCDAVDRVGPKGGRQCSAIAHFFVIFTFCPHGADSPFQNVRTHTHSQKTELIFRFS